MRAAFWENIPLTELTKEEWEALCDGCALCCTHKLEDEETGHIAITDVSCKYLDLETCQCEDYENRHVNVPDCVPFNSESAHAFFWLPDTCAYRRRALGKALPEWHYLISGDKNKVHELELSVQSHALHETLIPEEDWQERVVRWVESGESI